MNGTNMKIVLRVAVIAMACFFILKAAQAQESWGSSRGSSGAGAWQAGSAGQTMSAPKASGSGGASWTAGRQNFGSPSQPGGVWHASAPSAAVHASPARSLAAGTQLPGRPSGIVGLSPAPVIGHSGVRPARPQLPHPSIGQHPSFKSQVGIAKVSRGSVLKSSRAGPTTFSSRGTNNAGERTGLGSSLGSTMENPPQLETLPTPTLLPEFPNP